jgi:hypothetical protein
VTCIEYDESNLNRQDAFSTGTKLPITGRDIDAQWHTAAHDY